MACIENMTKIYMASGLGNHDEQCTLPHITWSHFNIVSSNNNMICMFFRLRYKYDMQVHWNVQQWVNNLYNVIWKLVAHVVQRSQIFDCLIGIVYIDFVLPLLVNHSWEITKHLFCFLGSNSTSFWKLSKWQTSKSVLCSFHRFPFFWHLFPCNWWSLLLKLWKQIQWTFKNLLEVVHC